MAIGLNASLTTATSQSVISSSAYNTNLANLNGAANPQFTTLSVDNIKKGHNSAAFWSLFGYDGVSDNEALRMQTDGSLLAIQNIAFSPFTTFIKACNRFSGTGSGTFSHGLGVTPTVVLLMQNTAGSQTLGWDTPSSTTVHITAAGGGSWTGFAFAT